jgi:hypothetical protein
MFSLFFTISLLSESPLTVRTIVTDIYERDVPRNLGALSSSFTACLLSAVSESCMANVDPDCMRFSGIKSFSNSFASSLTGFPWNKAQPLRDQLPPNPKLNFLMNYFAAIFRLLSETERKKTGALSAGEIIHLLNSVGVRSNLPFQMVRQCIDQGYRAQLQEDAALPSPQKPAVAPAPVGPVKCEAFYADYERCQNLEALTTLTK